MPIWEVEHFKIAGRRVDGEAYIMLTLWNSDQSADNFSDIFFLNRGTAACGGGGVCHYPLPTTHYPLPTIHYPPALFLNQN